MIDSTKHTETPSLFSNGEVATSISVENLKRKGNKNMLELLYGGFYLVFLLKNGYTPKSAEQLKEDIIKLLNSFEGQARRLEYSAESIHKVKYAFCALVDEIIMTQKSSSFDAIKNTWAINPLQLSLFGSQLAGEIFFSDLEDFRAQGLEKVDELEVYYYCLLIGFQGKYRLDVPEKINYLIARVGDEIKFLKGNKSEFAPAWNIPDKIKNVIHGEMPFAVILGLILTMGLIALGAMRFEIGRVMNNSIASYSNLIQQPEQNANITIYLP